MPRPREIDMSPELYFWNKWAMRGIPYTSVSYMSFVWNGGWSDEAKGIGNVSPMQCGLSDGNYSRFKNAYKETD